MAIVQHKRIAVKYKDRKIRRLMLMFNKPHWHSTRTRKMVVEQIGLCYDRNKENWPV